MDNGDVIIDGSMGEGGGQIVRTSLALSMLTGKGFRLLNIRSKRKKPGLQRQHLAAVQAAQTISHAEVSGGSLGSAAITFRPGNVRGGSFRFDVGSAGSATLVLQTVLPPLMLADRASHLTITGGTHNPWAPPVDFLQRTFLPVLRRMGPEVNLELESYGFYPSGGGVIHVEVRPAKQLRPIELLSRGKVRRIAATALVSRLPESIGEREIGVIREGIRLHAAAVCHVSGPGPGNVVTIEIASDAVTEVVTGFGQRGVPAETVAATALGEAKGYLSTEAPVGRHLADQVLLPMALASGSSCFRTGILTEHAVTNIRVIEKFLDVRFSQEQRDDGTWEIGTGDNPAYVEGGCQ